MVHIVVLDSVSSHQLQVGLGARLPWILTAAISGIIAHSCHWIHRQQRCSTKMRASRSLLGSPACGQVCRSEHRHVQLVLAQELRVLHWMSAPASWIMGCLGRLRTLVVRYRRMRMHALTRHHHPLHYYDVQLYIYHIHTWLYIHPPGLLITARESLRVIRGYSIGLINISIRTMV